MNPDPSVLNPSEPFGAAGKTKSPQPTRGWPQPEDGVRHPFLLLRHAIFEGDIGKMAILKRICKNCLFPCVAWGKSHVARGRKSGLTN